MERRKKARFDKVLDTLDDWKPMIIAWVSVVLSIVSLIAVLMRKFNVF